MAQPISVNSDYQITIRGDFGVIHTSIRPTGQVIAYNEVTKEAFISRKNLKPYVDEVINARRNGSDADKESAVRRFQRAIVQTNDSTKTTSLQTFLSHVASREVENIRLGAVVGGVSDQAYRDSINEHAKAVERENKPSSAQNRENRAPVNDINSQTVSNNVTMGNVTMAEGSEVTQVEVGLLQQLTNGVVALVFKKVNGSRREMLATLNADIIRQVSPSHATQLPRKHNKNVISIFDLEKYEYRTFKSTALFPINSDVVNEFSGIVPSDKVFMNVAFVSVPKESQWARFSKGELTFYEYLETCFPRNGQAVPQPTAPTLQDVNPEGLSPIDLADAHARYLIEYMTTNAVEIQFEKREGEIRDMVATRNLALVPTFEDVKERNSPTFADMVTEAGTEHFLGRRRVGVIDMEKNAKREFNIDRLLGYKNANGTYVNVAEQIRRAEEELARRIALASEPTANEVYSIDQMLEVLNNNVVRAVVTTSSSEYRVMYATRNQGVIQMHEKIGTVPTESTSTKTPEERHAEMVEKRNIPVFDVAKQGWITLSVDKLHKIDAVENVPSWIEFDVDTGDWFAVMKGRVTVPDGYTGRGFLGRDMQAIDKERLMYESNQFRYSTLKQTLELDTSWKGQLEVAYALKDKALATVESYTSQDLETYDVMREFAYALQRSWTESFESKTADATMVFSDIKEVAKDKLIIIRFNWGRDVLFLHPRFVVNANSHKVYADRTEAFKFPNRALSHNVLDVKLQIQLEQVASYVTARRKADILTKVLDEADMRRLKRLHQVIKQQKAELEEVGIKFGGTKAYPTQIKVKLNNKAFMSISPEYILDDVRKQFTFIRTPETTYVSEIEPKIAPNSANPLGKVLAVYMQACDLRRTVKDDNGNPM